MINKVRVVNAYGDTSVAGMIDPAVGMVTNRGTIAAVDAYGVCTMGDTGTHVHGGRSRFYAHQLLVTAANAAGFGWPNSGGSVRFGHQSEAAVTAGEIENRKGYVISGPGGVPYTGTYSQ